MPIVIVEAVAPVASWRPPEALTYHRTLPLPPYTAQVGLLGAALGLGPKDVYNFVTEQALRLGVGGWHNGVARDLWKFQKLEKAAQGIRDIVIREQNIDARLALVVEAPTGETAARIAAAFRAPAYPLTTGTSDALLLALAVTVEETAPASTRQLIHTLIYEEISPLYRPYEELRDIPLTRTVQAPRIESLPTGFFFDADADRRLAGRALVSFVADPIELDASVPPVTGFQINPRSRPLRTELSKWKGLPWTIPVHRYELTPAPAGKSSTSPSPNVPTAGNRGRPTGNT
jgi:CRISPR-associated protein Cas5t